MSLKEAAIYVFENIGKKPDEELAKVLYESSRENRNAWDITACQHAIDRLEGK